MHSHLQSALAFAYSVLYALRPKLAQAALAEPGEPGGSLAAALPGTGLPVRPRYAALLALAYALAPVLAFATWRALAPVLPRVGAAGVGASLLLVVPLLVHVAHNATGRAALAFVSLVGYLALGSAGGALLGRTLARLGCEPDGDCGLSVLGGLLLGAALGALLGYCIHAVRQVRVTAALQG